MLTSPRHPKDDGSPRSSLPQATTTSVLPADAEPAYLRTMTRLSTIAQTAVCHARATAATIRAHLITSPPDWPGALDG